MTDPVEIEVSSRLLNDVMAALPAAAREPESGIVYVDGTLYVPQAFASAASAAVEAMSSPSAQAAREMAALKAYAAARRFAAETGGIVVGGQQIDTSRESQSMINGAYALVSASSTPIRFKAASGWVTLSPEDVQAIALAVGAHVQACFAVEADLSASIDAGIVTDTAAIDAANWP